MLHIAGIVVFLVVLTIGCLIDIARTGHSDVMDREGGPGCCIAMTILAIVAFGICFLGKFATALL